MRIIETKLVYMYVILSNDNNNKLTTMMLYLEKLARLVQSICVRGLFKYKYYTYTDTYNQR